MNHACKHIHSSIRLARTNLALGILLSILGTQLAAAAPPTASAAAWDMDVDISVAGLDVLNLDAQNELAFVDQSAAFDQSVGAVSFDSGAGSLARLTTDDIQVQTQWVPGSTFHVVGAQASIANLALNVVGTPVSLLAVSAEQIIATAIVSGSCPPPVGHRNSLWVDDMVYVNGFDVQNLAQSSDVAVPGLAISLQGTALADIPTNPTPNTELSIGSLLTLVLNERDVTGDGISTRGVSTNALRLDVNVLDVITAHVVLSHAEASITCH